MCGEVACQNAPKASFYRDMGPVVRNGLNLTED